MESVPVILKVVAIGVAVLILGRWFRAEQKKCIMERKPIQNAYFSTPGIIIMVIMLTLPVVVWWMQK